MKMRHVCLFLSVWFFAAQPVLAAAERIDESSEKYAALMMDADTGEVFYERNADSRRYPASLTKMMTLYMTFEALKNKRMRLDTALPVSAHAAGQPQTNISLKAGQTIRVHDAIKALVVRSANDVSVVLAEALGKTEGNFALQMTAKARSLGMSRTQFRNPHGLPDRQQYTTARDMAKLSIALRRDFPQYYDYFKTEEFTWKGRTYTSHNRVMGQFDGVDGIKTGYINMSGFNLATSVKRDGYHVVGVVMGGQTGRIRDAHMVSLLEDAFTVIAQRGDQPRAFAAAPLPKAKPVEVAASAAGSGGELPWFKVSFDKGEDAAKTKAEAAPAPQVEVAALSTPAPEEKPNQVAEKKEKESSSFIRFVSDAKAADTAPKNSLNFQLASLSDRAQLTAQQKWGIQVGAFRDEASAMQAASKAQSLARSELKYSQINISDTGEQSASIHRARLAGLTESQAKRACQMLSAKSTPCFVFKLDSRNL